MAHNENNFSQNGQMNRSIIVFGHFESTRINQDVPAQIHVMCVPVLFTLSCLANRIKLANVHWWTFNFTSVGVINLDNSAKINRIFFHKDL